jgi:hypothetical protein
MVRQLMLAIMGKHSVNSRCQFAAVSALVAGGVVVGSNERW